MHNAGMRKTKLFTMRMDKAELALLDKVAAMMRPKGEPWHRSEVIREAVKRMWEGLTGKGEPDAW